MSGLKRKKGLLITLCVFFVLLLVYFLLRGWNRRQEKEKEARELQEVIHITDTEAGDIVSFSYDMGNGELAFEKRDGQWYYTEDEDFPLDQSVPEQIVQDISQITADRELTDGDALEDYGLDEPSCTLAYTDASGETTKVAFGDMTGDYYYALVNETGPVYTAASSVMESLNYTLDDMAVLDDYPAIGSGNLIRESVTQNGEMTTYDSENEDQAEDIAAVAGGLGAVTLSEAADYSVEEEDLAGYGLDEASRITVEAVYTTDEEENTIVLYIGAKDESGNRYVMINDSRIVYLLSDEVCKNILNC